jgi:streptogramin lyase
MLVLCLVVIVGCTTGVGQQPPTPTLSAAQTSPSTSTKGASGGVVEYAVANPSAPGVSCAGCGTASLSGMTVGPDGNVWFFDTGLSLVGRITPAGAITEFKVPATAAGSRSITRGPDGNIWLTTIAAGVNEQEWIVRITPAGEVTPFPLPKHRGPESITAGPDGNLWFTEFWSGTLGRMTPAGVLTEFTIPTPNSYPRGIVTGPDGNLWFLEASRVHTAIARATPRGVITEFVLSPGVSDLNPTSIVSGPDGNLWFAGGREIDRVTVQGAATHFQLQGQGMPAELAFGPDGNLWFTDAPTNSIGRMNVDGKMREFPLPRQNAQPYGIAAGSDGRIWFTETGVSRIGSIGLTVPAFAQTSMLFNFGSAPGATQTVVVTNAGDAPLKIESATVAGPDQAHFRTAGDTCGATSVAVGAQCKVSVAFSGASSGAPLGAYLRFVDNATGSPHLVYLIARLPACRLPVFNNSGQDTNATAAFLNPLTGETTTDPAGGFVADGNRVRSTATPVLTGYLPATYDGVAKRWVPASEQAISPDHTRYVYTEYVAPYQARLHVVDIATGRDRTLTTPAGSYGVLRFAAEGIYVNTVGEGTGAGASLINVDTGAVRQLNTTDLVLAIGDGAMWIARLNPKDPNPPVSGMGGPLGNEVDRRDLTTGATTAWFYRPGASVWVVALSAGEVVIRADGAGGGFWVVTGANKAVPILDPGTGEPLASAASLTIDGDHLWLTALDGLYLWSPRLGSVLVSTASAAPVGTCA